MAIQMYGNLIWKEKKSFHVPGSAFGTVIRKLFMKSLSDLSFIPIPIHSVGNSDTPCNFPGKQIRIFWISNNWTEFHNTLNVLSIVFFNFSISISYRVILLH